MSVSAWAVMRSERAGIPEHPQSELRDARTYWKPIFFGVLIIVLVYVPILTLGGSKARCSKRWRQLFSFPYSLRSSSP